MRRVILLFVSLTSIIVPVNAFLAAGDMTSDLICPCECAMVISTCDCPTAVRVKTEISSMTNAGFSEKQVFSALQAEYGKDILSYPGKSDSMPLLMAGAPLALILAFLGYTITKKPNPDIIPDRKKYEKRFEEEYQKFLSELEET